MSLVGDLSHALPSHKFLEMATINGAKALGLDHLIGSLEVGKKADITAIEILAEPVYSIANNIVSVGTNRFFLLFLFILFLFLFIFYFNFIILLIINKNTKYTKKLKKSE